MGTSPEETPRQPLLHDLAVTVAAPTLVLSQAGGDVQAGAAGRGAQGVFHADLRALSRLTITVDSRAPEPLYDAPAGPGAHHFVAFSAHRAGRGPDPVLRVDRHRRVTPGHLEEEFVLTSAAAEVIETRVELQLECDLLPIGTVKAGRPGTPLPGRARGGDGVEWSGEQLTVRVRAPGGDSSAPTEDPAGWAFAWRLRLEPGSRSQVRLLIDVHDGRSVVRSAPAAPTWARPQVEAGDHRLGPLVRQSLDDLHGLRMTDAEHPGNVFLAAGAPWFFTLFGRDSLWAARMLLPLGTELARGTLQVLARRQGVVDDPGSEEEPGKILHELRGGVFDDGGGLVLPPVYYGTVDATPLWVCLLHDAWRWGLAPAEVESLLPHLDAALGWIARSAEAGGGFLRYLDRRGAGLANQGWKDSSDAVRFADGSLAGPPLALAEVQGYAHEAALAGAALLDAFGRPGADRWRAFATDLRRRFRDAFWVADGDGWYPAMALDGKDRPADAVASNMGHLLGSGLLDLEETAAVARRLGTPAMSSGYGLRTMASTAGGYGSLSYHCGTVWPHDTVIAVAGLARAGATDVASRLVDGLLAASITLGTRLPELWSGDARADLAGPVPYPAACRPQAWAAASGVALVAAILGLAPDAPAGTIIVRPLRPSPVGALTVRGLVAAGRPLEVRTDPDGTVAHLHSAAGLRPG